MTGLSRFRTLSAGELWWRGRALAHVQGDRLRSALGRPRWDRTALGAVLAPEVCGPLRGEIARGNWMRVHDALADRLRGRPGRFVIDPGAAPALRTAILARWPDAARDAAARGDRLIAGRHDLLGYRDLSFGGPSGAIDWHLDPVHGRRAPARFWADVPYLDPVCGDHKIIWEINRHQHWLALGRALWLTRESRYRAAILGQLASWLAANPPLTGINWASMLEIGFRAISWIWALHILLGDESDADGTPWLVDLLIALDRQLTHVEHNLSYYFSPNTHLTGEALALYVAGRVLPELAASARRVDTGRSVLLAEIDRQIIADGGHAERSTHYHRYTLDFYLLALIVARRTGDAHAAAQFTGAVSRLASYMRAMADDRGRIPLIGDDDGGMLWPFEGPAHADVRASLALAAVLLDRPALAPWPCPEEVYWLAWHSSPHHPVFDARGPWAVRSADAQPPGVRAAVFPETGYVTVRDDRGGHLTFDVGPHGYLNGGHAHADALAVTLTIDGRALLIDPGTATYTMDPRLRDRLRLSASHNTVTIDGRSMAEPAGPFHWTTRTDARLDAWRDNPQFAWAEGIHDGYPGLRHRRCLLGSSAGWLIVDEIRGAGWHRADAHWHFDPDWHVENDGGARLRARHADGAIAWLVHQPGDLHLERGGEGAGLGWCSRSYGTIEPAWTARVTQTGMAPLVLVTWIGAGDAERPPVLQWREGDGDATGTTLAVHLAHASVESLVLLRLGDAPPGAGRLSSAGAYHTDGRLLRVARRHGRLASLDLVDATEAVALRDDWLSVSAGGDRIADLHLAVAGDCLELWASAPPARLEVRGAIVGGVRRVRMNRQEVPFRASEADGALVAHPLGAGTAAGSATA